MASLVVRCVLMIGILILLILIALPFESFGQGRGRGRGSSGYSVWGRKCEKFVNCHDARDGRWDNRGPRRRMTLRQRSLRNYWRHSYYNRYGMRRHRLWQP